MKNLRYVLGGFLLIIPSLALAYIGPGLGAGAVAAVIGTCVGLLMLIVGVIWYPIKKLIKRLRRK